MVAVSAASVGQRDYRSSVPTLSPVNCFILRSCWLSARSTSVSPAIKFVSVTDTCLLSWSLLALVGAFLNQIGDKLNWFFIQPDKRVVKTCAVHCDASRWNLVAILPRQLFRHLPPFYSERNETTRKGNITREKQKPERPEPNEQKTSMPSLRHFLFLSFL